GYPDAERDSNSAGWYEHLLVRPEWFSPATAKNSTLIVGRKGSGKSAVKLASLKERESKAKVLSIEASADELASLHAARLREAMDRGFGAVADWTRIYAELIVRNVAKSLSGKLVSNDDEIAVRSWAAIEGITERDFGERVAGVVQSLVPWAKSLATDQQLRSPDRSEIFDRVATATEFVLYVDDFDNLQEGAGVAAIRLIRDAVEAADRITHAGNRSEVHLLMRQDLWLRIRPGWHYADKVTGVVQLNWSQDDLKKWAERRLRYAVSVALNIDITLIRVPSSALWEIFFPETVELRNEKQSSALHYMVRRTMYTPRGLRQFMELAVLAANKYPVTLTDIENAEISFSSDQLEFLKTEFGGLCVGLDVCLQSFTGKPLEWIPSELYKHLRGLIGNGQVRLEKGASDGEGEFALARFLFRIGFLEVRYPDGERWEVRDTMRYPEHWKSIRQDDAIRWAVRSAFYNVLRSHR
ncbi:MAG: P-loop ATPase, Sll1717 family, partial [Gammaproteobacteria bacterium]